MNLKLDDKVNENCPFIAFFFDKRVCLLRSKNEDSSNKEKKYLSCVCTDYPECQIYLDYKKKAP
ncbi:hypothetical protein KAI04_00165 [Candidatus Pacearchaeota archaeon]|nr:hypothetical protein [Candidatus Pacearchaeota archaeon]